MTDDHKDLLLWGFDMATEINNELELGLSDKDMRRVALILRKRIKRKNLSAGAKS